MKLLNILLEYAPKIEAELIDKWTKETKGTASEEDFRAFMKRFPIIINISNSWKTINS